MKKLLFILLTVLIACKSKQENTYSKQEVVTNLKIKNPNYKPLNQFEGDSLKYLQTNFLENKNQYLGKPLNILFDDLEIDIKAYSNSYSSNLYLSNGLSLNFYSRSKKKIQVKNKKNPLVLTIEWAVFLPQEKIVELIRKNNGRWTEEEKNYYGQHIIKDIGMVVPNY